MPLIRQVLIHSTLAPDQPVDDVKGTWTVCSPTTVKGFTAVGFFFARKLQPTIGVPVGLIKSAWGGTPAEAWSSREALEAEPRAQAYLADWNHKVQTWDPEQAKARDGEAMAKWREAAEKAKAADEKPPRQPRPTRPPTAAPHYPSTLYNGMIAPLVPYAIKGAIWYQGEANAGRAWTYQTIFANMIADWRKQWGADFPFGVVQLANFRNPRPDPADDAWAELREAQAMATRLPNVGLACIIDVGAANDIHPKDKITVGERLALWALATVYGEQVVYSGPVFKSLRIDGNRAIVSFDHVGAGLTAGEMKPFGEFKTTPDAPLAWFQIAGANQAWVKADATLNGDTVIVSSEQVPAPVAVRYAWSTNPVGCNLYNREGLPAVPFRTDDWPISTQPRL